MILGTTNTEGFKATIFQDEHTREVFFKGDADIDADGANGQNGKVAAYMRGNKGSEDCRNGGMKMLPDGRLVGNSSWYKDIVILDSEGQPKEFKGGVYGSKSAYHLPNVLLNTPEAYLDAETIPYIVVPPLIISKTGKDEIIMGCRVFVLNTSNGKASDGMVGDVGPRNKVGEVSIEMARRLGINSSPKYGGEERPIIEYHIFPSQFYKKFSLQKSNGQYVHFPETQIVT